VQRLGGRRVGMPCGVTAALVSHVVGERASGRVCQRSIGGQTEMACG
jgi:hypothetical protein